jgi:hypothetical protein
MPVQDSGGRHDERKEAMEGADEDGGPGKGRADGASPTSGSISAGQGAYTVMLLLASLASLIIPCV